MSEEKKRGRKPGSKMGPRRVYYSVGLTKTPNNPHGNLIESMEEIFSPEKATEIELNEFTAEKVKSNLESQGFTVLKIHGPYHAVKGMLKPSQKKEQSAIKDDVEFGTCLGKGILDGWEGSVFAVKNRTDVVCFLPIKNISGGKGTKNMDYANIKQITMLTNSEDEDLEENDSEEDDLFDNGESEFSMNGN